MRFGKNTKSNSRHYLREKSKIRFPSEPLRAIQYSGSASRSGGGLSSVVMLLVGLLMGGGISVYFKDSERKAEARFQEEKQKMLADQRTLADSMALLHSSFADLVTGKSQSIPQLQSEMARIQKIFDDKIYIVTADTADQRAHLIKKIPAGDRLDRAREYLEHDKVRRIKKLDDEYKPSLRVFEKRILLYKDLLGEQQHVLAAGNIFQPADFAAVVLPRVAAFLNGDAQRMQPVLKNHHGIFILSFVHHRLQNARVSDFLGTSPTEIDDPHRTFFVGLRGFFLKKNLLAIRGNHQRQSMSSRSLIFSGRDFSCSPPKFRRGFGRLIRG